MAVAGKTITPKDAAAEAMSTWGGVTAATPGGAAAAGGGGPVSRGYREEMEDFAYCVRLWDPKLSYSRDDKGAYKQRLPRCHGEVAMADAIVALTANDAMKKPERIKFDPEWFKVDPSDP